eukprot:TRINITY_DN6865_c0_g1_i14.p1 TRINITY_DN6865_c0_g1~~TRINITY_DN6865_c0_g1_i14.p1  ORF type:complete len:147 (-),score=13.83 TRINITY_DN6865_c0_g1_i14:138-578(-)
MGKGIEIRKRKRQKCHYKEGAGDVTSLSTNTDNALHILNFYNPTPTKDFRWLREFPNNWLIIGDFNRRDSMWDSTYDHSSPTLGEDLQVLFSQYYLSIYLSVSSTYLCIGQSVGQLVGPTDRWLSDLPTSFPTNQVADFLTDRPFF